MRRQGNNPKRRLVPVDSLDEGQLDALALKVSYVCSGHHKRNPADCGLDRTNPRPTKSLCDLTRIIRLDEARQLLARGIKARMISTPLEHGFPKYVWCVADDGMVYEAKTDVTAPGPYHGYPIVSEPDVCAYILAEWKKRCP